MTRHITLPKGFTAAGIKCGIKKSGKHDLAIIAAHRSVPTAMVTTTNQVIGAPVMWSRSILPADCGNTRAMVINSGNSNVCTGPAGLKNARTMAVETARQLGCRPQEVLVASTGIIGVELPIDKIKKGIAQAAQTLSRNNDSPALQAIMTTDLKEKFAVIETKIDSKPVTLAGMVKGSGMIAPSMATMIAIITTDAAISPTALRKALRDAVKVTFNAITVDSDTSTSDTVVAMASGMAGNGKIISPTSSEYKKFFTCFCELCKTLSRKIIDDGEGATKVIDVEIVGARNEKEAAIAAKSVADSPLFKTAMHGCDPNWGRIAAALGKSPAKIDPEKLTIKIGGTVVFRKGRGAKFDHSSISKYLRNHEVCVSCNLGLGDGKFTAVTCDLSREYITINADYHT